MNWMSNNTLVVDMDKVFPGLRDAKKIIKEKVMKHPEFKISLEHDCDDDWEFKIEDVRICKKDPAEMHSQLARLFSLCEQFIKVAKESHIKDEG